MDTNSVSKRFSWQQRRGQWLYVGPIIVGDKIFNLTETLGRVRIRADLRYDWFVSPSLGLKNWPTTHSQGVAETLEDATNTIENCWNAATDPSPVGPGV